MQTFDNSLLIEKISKELGIPVVEATELFEKYFTALKALVLQTKTSYKIRYSMGILYVRTIDNVKTLLYRKPKWLKFHKIQTI